MQRILVQGLEGQGPGDIVGAFVGEAGVSPEHIGEIDVQAHQATVEVDPDVAEEVVSTMDGNRVGDSQVTVTPAEDGSKDGRPRVLEYTDRYARLVEMERREEMRRHEDEIRSLSGREREAKGRALLSMTGRDEGEGLGGFLVKFVKTAHDTPLPETEISVGDLVMVSKQDPLRDDNPTGTVVERTNGSITAAFDTNPPSFVFGEGLRLDLYVNDVTYQRMKDALATLRDADGRLAELRDVLIGTLDPPEPETAAVEAWHNPELNDSQRRAVRRAVDAEDVHLIHGPPGTGKTTTAIEVIQQAVADDRSVLATAASNTAVDNLVEFLLDQEVNAVRVGHPARVTPTLREHTLDRLVQDHEAYREGRKAREKAFALKDRQDEHTYPSGRWRRGMGDAQIRRLAEQDRGSRGVPPDKIESMARWLELEEQVDELFEEAERLEGQAVREVLASADVVCTTNSTAGSELLDGLTFDLLVVDEATQATEPSTLIPITHADKVVMAGDHRQLPPTVIDEEAARQGLRESLFERVAEEHGDVVLDMLQVQYRMHEDIMGFSAERFYGGKLEAAQSVRDHTLADLNVDPSGLDEPIRGLLEPEPPVAFVDTRGRDASERSPPGSPSKENPREAEIVAKLARGALASGLEPRDVAVITPYDAQRDRIEGLVEASGLEVDTVDGFQGREKELVLISLVRSNDERELGFLEDLRRLNVALTRARRKRVVVGDRSTVGANDTYEAFVEHAGDVGQIVRVH